jgi:CRISPR-associated protein Csx3
MPVTRPLLRYTDLPLIHTGRSPRFEFLPDGALHALRADNVLLNLVLGCPLGGSLHRLALSVGEGENRRAIILAGPGSDARFCGDSNSTIWELNQDDLAIRAHLQPFDDGWSVEFTVRNHGDSPVTLQAVHGLDLALTTQFAARLNESYTSQYLDHRELIDPLFGRAIATRQNLAIEKKHPWLIQTFAEGTAGFSTDATDFFGLPAQRSSGEAIALLDPPSPGRVRQDESAYIALFSEPLTLAPGETGTRRFLAVYQAHHPEASEPKDVEHLHRALAELPSAATPEPPLSPAFHGALRAPRIVHGEAPSETDLEAWFPGSWHSEERLADGRIASLFHGSDREHVVTFDKEAVALRPHALILRSGSAADASDDTLDVTCHMAGVFQSLLAVGHPSFHRLLSPVRERLGLIPSSGQRIGYDAVGGLAWLGIPSAFAMSLTSCRWLYRLPGHLIEVVVSVSPDEAASLTEVRVLEGGPLKFITSLGLTGGEREGEETASVEIDGLRAIVQAGPDSLARKHFPEAKFLLETDNCAELGGGELLGWPGEATSHLVAKTSAVDRFAIRFSGFTRPPKHAGEASSIWRDAHQALRVGGLASPPVENLDSILPWFVHNGLIHYSVPHGLEQWNGGAWGVRDVTQGSVELLLAIDRPTEVREILLAVFSHQYLGTNDWPQWFMLDPFGWIQQRHSHGDIPLWPLKALCDYLEATSDFALLDEAIDWTDANTARPASKPSVLRNHVEGAIAWMRQQCFPGTALLRYGEGDWDDSLQPAKPELREHMVSAWTVALSYQVLRRLEELARRTGESFAGLDGFADGVHADFHRWLMPDGIACGFFVFDADGKSGRPLLHPQDETTGIHYRLLPMKRAILSGLFSPEQAQQHLAVMREHLLAADGMRLMDRPAPYRGGPRETFERAESSAAFAREIGVFYTHAHLRYLEMLSVLGEADALWHGLQQINPVGIRQSVPHALPRQANLYFSSSDAAVHDRYEAAERYDEIVAGKIPVAVGWRLYSSGPGIFCHLVRSRVLGLRRHYDRILLDPVLPAEADGLEAHVTWDGKPIKVIFRKNAPGVRLNAVALHVTEAPNPYRKGGCSVDAAEFAQWLFDESNTLEIGF